MVTPRHRTTADPKSVNRQASLDRFRNEFERRRNGNLVAHLDGMRLTVFYCNERHRFGWCISYLGDPCYSP